MTDKIVEPNYHVILIVPAGSLEPAKEFDLIIPTITKFQTFLDLVITRQGLDEEKTWGIYDERYPNDLIDVTTYPLLVNYHIYRGNGKGIFELDIKEVV